MYPSLLWSDFTRLNHIKSLTMLEQKRAYDNYQQLLLQEYMTRQLQLQMQMVYSLENLKTLQKMHMLIQDSRLHLMLSLRSL